MSTRSAPHPGRSSRSSRRARQRTSRGASAVHASRYSTRSRSVGSAQWMSSRTTTSGCSSASASRKRLHGPEDLAGRGCALGLAGQLRHALGDQRRLVVALEERRDRRPRPLGHGLTDDLGQREVGGALPVRRRSGRRAPARPRSGRTPAPDASCRPRRRRARSRPCCAARPGRRRTPPGSTPARPPCRRARRCRRAVRPPRRPAGGMLAPGRARPYRPARAAPTRRHGSRAGEWPRRAGSPPAAPPARAAGRC